MNLLWFTDEWEPHHVVIPKGGFCAGKPWPRAPLNAYLGRAAGCWTAAWRDEEGRLMSSGWNRNGPCFCRGLGVWFGVRFFLVKHGRCAKCRLACILDVRFVHTLSVLYCIYMISGIDCFQSWQWIVLLKNHRSLNGRNSAAVGRCRGWWFEV